MISENTTASRSADADAAGLIKARALGRHRLGAELRQLRQARSLRLEDVAARLEVAPSTLSRMETGLAPVKPDCLTALLYLYGVQDQEQRAQLAGLARDGRCASWHDGYRDLLPAGASHYLDLETAAVQLRSYSVQVVPGLAQTAGYAAAAVAAARPGLTDDQVRALVTLQLRRQELMLATGCPVHLIVDESALLRLVGTAPVMAAQLRHLLTLAAYPAVTLQVAELARPCPVLTLPLTILSVPGPAQADVACQAGIGGQITISARRADLCALRAAFTDLAGASASPEETATLISKAAGHWEQQAHHDR